MYDTIIFSIRAEEGLQAEMFYVQAISHPRTQISGPIFSIKDPLAYYIIYIYIHINTKF